MNTDDFTLFDDGTLDTVIEFGGREYRFCGEFAANWRNDTGELRFEEFINDNRDMFDNEDW